MPCFPDDDMKQGYNLLAACIVLCAAGCGVDRVPESGESAKPVSERIFAAVKEALARGDKNGLTAKLSPGTSEFIDPSNHSPRSKNQLHNLFSIGFSLHPYSRVSLFFAGIMANQSRCSLNIRSLGKNPITELIRRKQTVPQESCEKPIVRKRNAA